MPFLEEAFPPQKLAWLSHNVLELSPVCRRALYEHLARAAATHGAETALYLKECLLCLAWCAPASPSCERTLVKVERHQLLAKTQPASEEAAFLLDMEHTIRQGRADINVYRLYLHAHRTLHVERTFTRETVNPASLQADPVHKRIMARLVVAFAKETTFKVHGDSSLHAEIITCMLPNFMASMLAYLETPYQLVASVYPTQVNDMVRPILATMMEERVKGVSFVNHHRVRDFILAASLLMELLGNKRAVLLTSATLCYASPDLVLMYVVRRNDSKYEVGLRSGSTLRVYGPTCTVADILVDFVEQAHAASPGLVENVHDLFHKPHENNALNKYV